MAATLTRKKSASQAAKRLVDQFVTKVKEVEVEEPPEMAGLVVLGTCAVCGTSHPRDKRWLGHYLGVSAAAHAFIPQTHLGIAQDPRNHWEVFEHYDSPAALEAAPGGAGQGLFAAMKERFLFALSTWVARHWLTLQEITDAIGDLPFLPDAAAIAAQRTGSQANRAAQEEIRRQHYIEFQRKKDPAWTWPTRPDGVPMTRQEIGRQRIRAPLQRQIAQIIQEENAEQDAREEAAHPKLPGIKPPEPGAAAAPPAKLPKLPKSPKGEKKARAPRLAKTEPGETLPALPITTRKHEVTDLEALQDKVKGLKRDFASMQQRPERWRLNAPGLRKRLNEAVQDANKHASNGPEKEMFIAIGTQLFETARNVDIISNANLANRIEERDAGLARLAKLEPAAAPPVTTRPTSAPTAIWVAMPKFPTRFQQASVKKMADWLENDVAAYVGNRATALRSRAVRSALLDARDIVAEWEIQRTPWPEGPLLKDAKEKFEALMEEGKFAEVIAALRDIGPEPPAAPQPAVPPGPRPISPRAAAAVKQAIADFPAADELAKQEEADFETETEGWNDAINEDDRSGSLSKLETRIRKLPEELATHYSGLNELKHAIFNYRNTPAIPGESKEDEWTDVTSALEQLSYVTEERDLETVEDLPAKPKPPVRSKKGK